MTNIYVLVRREFLIALRNRHEMLHPLLFFVLVCLLFPFGVGPAADLLLSMAPGIIWTAALLAILMTLGTLFRNEHEDGTLEQMLLSSHSLYVIVTIKLFTHWLLSALPLIVLSPLIAASLGGGAPVQLTLVASLLLGTPVLVLIGAIASALTLVIQQNGMLLALLVLPLFVPVLIFGTSAVNSAASGMSTAGPLYVLATLLAASLTLAPFAIVAALKTGVSQ